MNPVVVRLSDSVSIINADCLDVLPVKCDAVVTDPPYGIGKDAATRRPPKYQRLAGMAPREWDNEAPDVSFLLPLSECVVIWGGNYYGLPTTRGWLSWFKPDAPPSMASFELAWTNRDMNARQISHSIAATNGERVGHPTQKPVRVMVWCMEQARVPAGAMVLDPFAGSGSTGIACIRTGRRFIGIERDAGHFATMRKRLENELRQGLLPLTFNNSMIGAS
jgi:site-specific DNA-methyltransferase (adenine-specific)/modification methylase